MAIDKQKVFLVIVIIALLIGLAVELKYIEFMLSTMLYSQEEQCELLCMEKNQIGYVSRNVCHCKEPIEFEKKWRCYPGVQFHDGGIYQNEFNTSSVRNIAVSSVVKYEGPNTYATKVFAIYNEVSKRIFYVSDPRKDEYIADPKETWEVRGGDCDDFSILLASLYEAIDIDASIVEVHNKTYGHVFVILHIDQDLNTFLRQYKQLLDKYTPYYGPKTINLIFIEDTRERCNLVNDNVINEKNVPNFYLVVESTTEDYAGSQDPIEGSETINFIKIGP
ncbi:MAG: hypothetical protein GTN76_16115 [Candidatus Aenigmarchaeota archaeon]|nr:hypothetical protein [Candidatus Aenigmarchaeota archaeon]